MVQTLKSVKVGESLRISIDDFNQYLNSIGAPPYEHDGKKGFIKVAEAAEWLNVSIGYIYKMIYAYQDEPLQVAQSKRVVA